MNLIFNMDMKSPREFRKFFQKEVYEEYVVNILNASIRFRNEFFLITNQSNSENDIKSYKSGIEYEITMLLDVNIVNKVRKDLNCWMDSDFAKWLNCEIEKNIIDRLEKKKNKKNIILFNVFPMRSLKFEKSIYQQFETDLWDIAIESIREKYPELVENKKVILLTYNIEDNFLIRDLISSDVYHKNEYIEFGDKDDAFPIRVTNMRVEK